MNQVTIQGNVTRDAEIKYFESGKILVTFGGAEYVNEKDQKRGVLPWRNVEMWTSENMSWKADAVLQLAKKGASFIAMGRLELSEYENKKTGKIVTSLKVIANEVLAAPRLDRADTYAPTASAAKPDDIPF